MRVLVLGGAGEMGATACRTLAALPGVTSLVIADRAGEAAARLASDLGGTAAAVRVDVSDRAALAAALCECDIVANAVGPFYRFGVPVLSAAIDAGRDYIDICDDPEPTLEMLTLDDHARAKGVTALVGMGASPGVANLLAVQAASELDHTHSVITGWNIDAAQSTTAPATQPSAAILHGMRQLSGTIPVLQDGALEKRRALERITLDYPGIGTVTGRSFGHPEPVTLPRGLPDLQNSTNVAFGRRSTLAGLAILRGLIDHVHLPEQRAAGLAARLEHLTPAGPADLLQHGGPPPLFALATGTRNAVPATVACALAQVPGLSMAANTAIPFAIAVPLVATTNRPGVHTPETLLDPAQILTELAQHCIGQPRADAMTVTTRSWATPAENAHALRKSLLTAFLASPARNG